MKNIFDDIPGHLPDEWLETIYAGKHVRIERIISRGHRSPDGFWYDQKKNEFVMIASGEGKVKFETDGRVVHLKAGDYCLIKAHEKHRVEWTSPGEDTIWLTFHFE